MLSLLLHNLNFSCPRILDDDPARDGITHEIKAYANNNNNSDNDNNDNNNNNNNDNKHNTFSVNKRPLHLNYY